MSNPKTVAFLGLGRMGRPMAANIANAGFPVVVYNRTRSTAEDFAAATDGVKVADSPREAAAGADVVVTMLADEPALRAVYEGPQGALAGWSPHKVALDMGTTGPAGTAWLARAVGNAGGTAIDSPVSGAVKAAETAGLTLMVGGAADVVEDLRPLLESMSATIYHLGESGAGAIMKLAVNNVIYALGQAVSESLVLAECSGIDRAEAYEVFCDSAIAAPMVKYRQDNYTNPGTSITQLALTLAAKDLKLITALADEVGAPMPQAMVNLDTAVRAIDDGLGDHDMAAVAVYLRNRTSPRS
ncbi:NAD(P)-dependent oxidoreductase [Amycolatopsis sp. K13G38]|uniref:NAD(P)-dependent oxidoreductase n=1 Tax=Amycolatopsis acididurans TaxID=2724524 RepID=A0ABX1J3G7_9PSEU|nr:NAD(P)-dependent oxidoreductase [Amycolatopsis acididurans]NKQ54298.1 NAD(P)-dependent oxidoreductase [Amycolatopsis acididurans]